MTEKIPDDGPFGQSEAIEYVRQLMRRDHERGEKLKRQAQAGYKWDVVLGKAAQRQHVTSEELAHTIEHFGTDTEAARKYVADRLRDKYRLNDGRPPKRATHLVRELYNAEKVHKRIKRNTARYKRVRLDRQRVSPREPHRRGRARLIESTGWHRSQGRWRISDPDAVAWRRETRNCDEAVAYAKALDENTNGDREDAKRQARRNWYRYIERVRAQTKEHRSTRHVQKIADAIQAEHDALKRAP